MYIIDIQPIMYTKNTSLSSLVLAFARVVGGKHPTTAGYFSFSKGRPTTA
jgi:hypothetical protein